jgi:hypothetical protein
MISPRLLKLLDQLDNPEVMTEVIDTVRNLYPVFPKDRKRQEDMIYIQAAYAFRLPAEKRKEYRQIALDRSAIKEIEEIPITYQELARKYGTPSFKAVWEINADVVIVLCPDKYIASRLTVKTSDELRRRGTLDLVGSRPGDYKLRLTNEQSIYFATANQVFSEDLWDICRSKDKTVKYKNVL